MRFYIFLFTFLASSIIVGQTKGTIAGKLTDKEYHNEPLPFANILLKGTTTGTTSDIDGLYRFENLTPGPYVLIFSFVGYEVQEIKIEVVANKVTIVNVPMGASSASLSEVVITTTTRKESEVALLMDQKKAVEIKQSIGAEELSRKGVSNAAGAVAKISGVSKQEGSSNVYVRGLGDRYLNTTLNGLSLPSNDVNKKNINLNLFSSDVIENVSISKAYSTRFYGDFSAGNVDISSKDYKGKGFLDLTAGAGFNTNAIGKKFVRSEGTGYFGFYTRYDHNPFAVILSHGIDPESARTPINTNWGGAAGKSFNFENRSRLSIFATGSFENSFEYRKGSAVDFTLTEKKAFVDSAEEYEYGTTTTGMANVNYQVNSDNSFKYNSLFINNSSDVVGYFGIDGLGRNRDAQLDTDKGYYQMNVQFDQTTMMVNQFEGNHTSGKLDLDWAAGYNLVDSRQPDRKRISLENYQLALDNDSNTNPTFYSNVVFDNQRYFQNIQDEEFNSRANLGFTSSEKVKFNFGYNGKLKKRDFDNIRYGYDIVDGTFPVSNVNDFNSIFTLDNLNLNSGNAGLYEIKVIRTIPTLSNTNRPGLPENTYNGKLAIAAGYLNAEIKVGDKWLFVPGARLESVDQSIKYDVINLGNNGNSTRDSHETFLLPSLNIKYALTEAQNLRFTASQTVSLPEFKEVAPFVYEGVTTRIGGNPDLLDKGYSEIINADLKYEWFISKNELFSLAVFGKQIKDPVNLVVGADATGTQRYFRTGEKATIYGIEVELRKNLITNEDDNVDLSFGLNATYMKTKQDLYAQLDGATYDLSFDTKLKDKLQGASPFLINADISYSPIFGTYKPTANLVFSYFSNRIDALGSGQLGNIIEKSVSTLDFIWKNEINKIFEINFSAKNLLNPKITYFRETTLGEIVVNSANGKDVSDYQLGMDISLQLKYKF